MVCFSGNKRGVTELTSFVLITLLIVVASSSAYIYSLDLIQSNSEQLDRKNMEIYLKKFDREIREIMNFQGASISMDFVFYGGQLEIKDNQMIYQSLVQTGSSSTNCFDGICYENNFGFERIYFNLSNSYNFSRNLTVGEGEYRFTFTNVKNESKISFKIS